MGREVVCRVRHAGQTAEVKALLETDAVILRGEIKATLPFASLKRVEAREGELILDGTILDLGAQAEKWAAKILNPPSLLGKLGLKPEMRIALVGFADTTFIGDLRFDTALDEKATYDAILYQANNLADLEELPRLKPSIESKTMLWIVYPKGRKDITESQVFAYGQGLGLVDVKTCRFSDALTGLKFVHRKG